MQKNQILFFGAPQSGKLSILEQSFGTLPDFIPEDTHSGISHTVNVKNKYFSIDLGIWVDETMERTALLSCDNKDSQDCYNKTVLEVKKNSFNRWCEEFREDEVLEVRKCLSGLIFCFNLRDDTEYIKYCSEKMSDLIDFMKSEAYVNDTGDDEFGQWKGITLAIGFKRKEDLMIEGDRLFEIEDFFISYGIEFINFNEKGMNEYKDKIGQDRFIEILETNDWTDINYEKMATKESEDTDGMQVGLLNNEELDIESILNKLSLAKAETSKLPEEKKKEYAQNVINELMNYL